jgi:hypothetical protein
MQPGGFFGGRCLAAGDPRTFSFQFLQARFVGFSGCAEKLE